MKIMKAPRRVLTAVAAAAMALSAGVALGGTVVGAPVKIVDDETGAGTVTGSMHSARNSANTVEYIACFLQANSGMQVPFGYCTARNAAGVYRTCALETGMIEAVKSIAAYSYIRFTYDDEGTCTSLQVSQSSIYLPAN